MVSKRDAVWFQVHNQSGGIVETKLIMKPHQPTQVLPHNRSLLELILIFMS